LPLHFDPLVELAALKPQFKSLQWLDFREAGRLSVSMTPITHRPPVVAGIGALGRPPSPEIRPGSRLNEAIESNRFEPNSDERPSRTPANLVDFRRSER